MILGQQFLIICVYIIYVNYANFWSYAYINVDLYVCVSTYVLEKNMYYKKHVSTYILNYSQYLSQILRYNRYFSFYNFLPNILQYIQITSHKDKKITKTRHLVYGAEKKLDDISLDFLNVKKAI